MIVRITCDVSQCHVTRSFRGGRVLRGGEARQQAGDEAASHQDCRRLANTLELVWHTDRHFPFRHGLSVAGQVWPVKVRAKRGRIVSCQVLGRPLGLVGGRPISPRKVVVASRRAGQRATAAGNGRRGVHFTAERMPRFTREATAPRSLKRRPTSSPCD